MVAVVVAAVGAVVVVAVCDGNIGNGGGAVPMQIGAVMPDNTSEKTEYSEEEFWGWEYLNAMEGNKGGG